jgi:hypothetical protein
MRMCIAIDHGHLGREALRFGPERGAAGVTGAFCPEAPEASRASLANSADMVGRRRCLRLAFSSIARGSGMDGTSYREKLVESAQAGRFHRSARDGRPRREERSETSEGTALSTLGDKARQILLKTNRAPHGGARPCSLQSGSHPLTSDPYRHRRRRRAWARAIRDRPSGGPH